MITAVLDTNVYISALLFPNSLPARLVVRGFRDGYRIVVSDEILVELRNSAHKPKLIEQYGLTQQAVDTLSSSLLSLASFVIVEPNSVSVSRDPDDDHVLAAALMSHADFIVTGDKDLLILKQYQGGNIVTISEFDAIIEQSS